MSSSFAPFPFLLAPPQNPAAVGENWYAADLQAVRHTMEIMADRYAGDVTLSFAFADLWNCSPGSCSEKTVKKLEKRGIQELGIALTVVFNIVDGISHRFHTHPHPKYRNLATVMSVLTVWTSMSRIKAGNLHSTPNEFLDTINDIQTETDEAWDCLGLPSFRNSTSDLSEAEFRGLLEQAIRLFPKLDSRFDKTHVI